MSFPATTLIYDKTKAKFYVQCTIPEDLREFFGNRKQIKRSTKTNDKRQASLLQHEISEAIYSEFRSVKKDEVDEAFEKVTQLLGDDFTDVEGSDNPVSFTKEQWLILKAAVLAAQRPVQTGDPEEDVALEGRGQQVAQEFGRLESLTESTMPFSEWVKTFIATEAFGRDKTKRETEAALAEFVEFTDDIPIGKITKVTGYDWAASIGADKSASTVKKKISFVSTALTKAEQRGEIELNPFRGLSLKGYGKSGKSRKPLSEEDIRQLFALNDTPDHVRLLLRILVTTGMRLDEAALLNWEEIRLDEASGLLVYDLTTRADTLKNKGSARLVPVHSSLIAEIGEPNGRTGPIFPQFARDADGKAQGPASGACMVEIRKVTDDPLKVTHSIRHSFKDKMRDVGVSKEVSDFITGHSSGDAAGGYGMGPSVQVRSDAIEKIIYP